MAEQHRASPADWLLHAASLATGDHLMRVAHTKPFADSDLNIAQILARGLQGLPENNRSRDWMENAVGICLGAIVTLTITPVPVAERMPGVEDCDAEGRCWWWIVDQPGELPHWIYCSLKVLSWTNFTAWLPHHALPVPGAKVG